jgi:Zn finger protein HypA/HybF involved in hydrogenase expression
MTVKKCSVCETSWLEGELDSLGRCHNCRGKDQHVESTGEKNERHRYCRICKTILPESELTSFDICRKCRSKNEALKQLGKKDKIRPSKQLNLNLLEEQ